MNLFDFGLDVYPADPQTFLPFPNGEDFISSLDQEETINGIARLSPTDVKTWHIFWADGFRTVTILKPTLMNYPIPQMKISKELTF